MFGWMGFNPGSTLGATDLRIGLVAVNTLLAACTGFVMAMGYDQLQVGETRHLDVVQRHARRPRRDHRTVRVRRAVGGGDHRRDRRRARRVQRRVLRPHGTSTTLRRDLGARRAARGACSPSGSSPTARTARVGTAPVASKARRTACSGIFYGDAGQLVAQIVHVVVGFVWAWGVDVGDLRDRQEVHADPRVARGRDPGARRARVRRARLPRLRAHVDARRRPCKCDDGIGHAAGADPGRTS